VNVNPRQAGSEKMLTSHWQSGRDSRSFTSFTAEQQSASKANKEQSDKL
jgi:hypothetical protein